MFTRRRFTGGYFAAIAGTLISLLLIPAYGYGQACTVSKLQLQFQTGSDDLRGGQNNVNAQIQFADGSLQEFDNLNRGQNWGGHSYHSVFIQLRQPISASQIKQITLVHLAQGGENVNQGNFNTALAGGGPPAALASLAGGVNTEDNWDMDHVTAIASGTGVAAQIASAGPYKFTGSNPSFAVPVVVPDSCGQSGITELRLTFDTANDDLRGGNDNLNLIIHYRDGSPDQFEPNVNHSMGWQNNSRHYASVLLARTSQVDSITLQTTFTGGSGGDNWSMNEVQVTGLGTGVHQDLATAGFYRFTGPPGNVLTVPITGWPAPPPVSGGVSHCSPNDTSDYCKMARLARRSAPLKSGPMLAGTSQQGLAGQTQVKGGLLQSSNAGSGSPQNSQSQMMMAAARPSGMSAAKSTPLLASAAGQQKVLTNADVILLVKSRRPESEIISSINSAQHRFDFSPAGCRSLTDAQVSQNILKVMNGGAAIPCASPRMPLTARPGTMLH
jgi:hypothetical protein